MNHYVLYGMDRETGADITVHNLAAENPAEAFAASEKAFPSVWFFSCRLEDEPKK